MTTGKKLTIFGAMALVLCLTMAMPAFGASARVSIPFAFEASSVSLPAGDYLLETSDSGAVLFLTGKESGRNAIIVAPAGEAKSRFDGKLVFEHSGSTYRLAQAQILGATAVMRIPATHAQLLMAKESPSERVVLALNRK
ncbi:hypothetical protein [Paludibaculum fermentans]|uniref:hypothetical protein n=1 Tax=Paludibaculum fermentans TaxID=1473598 RepID=UPI003EBF080D